ncbi:hypothetical protein HCJ93_28230 [Streptomyces sp. SBST2-5]|uniref:Uncharacterized protein n=1 Tax=Streptomyces composti TaxID=2720025 RepID=A0ABX1AJX7_9ACTN|nr:hypothetical protein [Streptomyces composti]NJP53851.1 hypothetical protein [Streptomyces composti]
MRTSAGERPDTVPDRAGRPGSVRCRVALAATDEARLADAAVTGPPDRVTAPSAHRTPAEAVTWALGSAFESLPEPVRRTAPLYVLSGDYSTWAARRFVRRCHDTGRRLRPSDSIGLEASELVRPYTTAAGHRGACYLLAPLAGDLFVPGVATAGGSAAVVLDLSLFPGGDPDTTGCLAVATAWRATRT